MYLPSFSAVSLILNDSLILVSRLEKNSGNSLREFLSKNEKSGIIRIIPKDKIIIRSVAEKSPRQAAVIPIPKHIPNHRAT